MIQCIFSMVEINVVNEHDTVAQMARCSFDVHVLDVLGTLIIGGTIVMLHPEGILDLEYLAAVVKDKQVTYIQAVPSILRAFFTFLMETDNVSNISCLRSLCSSGK